MMSGLNLYKQSIFFWLASYIIYIICRLWLLSRSGRHTQI